MLVKSFVVLAVLVILQAAACALPSRYCSTVMELPCSPSLNVPATDHRPYRSMAIKVFDGLLTHYRVDSAGGSHILDTFNGYARKDDPRGVLWERAMFASDLANLYALTRDRRIKELVREDWAYLQVHYTIDQLQSCGVGSNNVAQDDAGWTILMFLDIEALTGDGNALNCAAGLYDTAYQRWHDNTLGGGLLYNDAHDSKSSYQASMILAGLRLARCTGDKRYKVSALALYEWVEETMRRTDGLYQCDFKVDGLRPVGVIREASSATFLAGNMAMAVVHAMLYRDTKNAHFLDRALRTVEAIQRFETDRDGCYLDDRDAWTDGYFMADWAREVLTLPGISAEQRDALLRTAKAIYTKDRTSAGYLGGSWGGPPEGPDSVWWKAGSRAEQIMTSAGAANVIIAAALLEAHRGHK